MMKAELAHRLKGNSNKDKEKNNTSLHLSAVESFSADGLMGLVKGTVGSLKSWMTGPSAKAPFFFFPLEIQIDYKIHVVTQQLYLK